MTYSDNYIEFWAEIYLANPEIRRRNILFWVFLNHPERILELVIYTPAPQDINAEPEPLLPEQAALRDRLDIEERQRERLADYVAKYSDINPTGRHPVRCSNGRTIEPLAHHARMDNKRSNFNLRRARG